MSIFQGAESIKVNTSFDRAAEEEALADQKRHKEELGKLLANAFDDLDDDDTTIDSTSNFQSHLNDDQQQLQNGHNLAHQAPANNGNAMSLQFSAFEAEMHQMKMLIESRTHESEHFKKLAQEEQKKRDEFQKRLCIAEAELDRALASKNNTHELLVECKEKCSNFENTISKLHTEKKSLESEHNMVLAKLETTQMLLADVQQKYDMVERDLGKNSQRNAELQRKKMEERHRAELEVKQEQMEQLSCKLDKKCSEFESLQARYNALQTSHESMLAEKGNNIKDLSQSLLEAQRKGHEYQQENIRLQKFIASLQDQIKTMEGTITSLTKHLDFTTAELDVMDSVLHQHNLEDTPRHLSQTQGKVVGSTPLNTIDRLGNLKDELYRALANIKSKRDDIRRLQQNLDDKTAEIRILREEENKALVQITTMREANVRLENRLKLLEQEYEELQNKSTAKSNSFSNNTNIVALQNQMQTDEQAFHEKCARLEAECKNHEMERKKMNVQLRNVEVDLEELKQEHESMKINYAQIMKENQNLRSRTTADNMRLELEKQKFLLKDAQRECDRLKNLYIEISNAKEALSYEVEKLRNTDSIKELREQREKVANLQRALQLAEVKSSELTKILDAEKMCHERDVEELKERWEKEKTENYKAAKRESSNNCSKCIDYMTEITKFEIQNLKLSNVNSINKKEIDDLTQQLNESKALIIELNEKLKLTEQQETLISELKAKAAQFEDFIKNQSSASTHSASAPSPLNQLPTNDDKKRQESNRLHTTDIKQIEARIRDEMSKLFASEIKRFQIKLHQTEEKNICLQHEYECARNDLQQRQTEVELLKQAILAEREHIEEVLNKKDAEAHLMIEKQTAILHKCRDELLAKNQRVVQLSKELEERQMQIEAERQSMKAVMMQWEEQRKHVDAIESEWKEKVRALERTHEKALAAWQKKYNSAKHTAANYKRYAEDKEAHMLREYDRLKTEYDASLTKIETRMKDTLEKKNREMRDAIATIEKHHELGYDKENRNKN